MTLSHEQVSIAMRTLKSSVICGALVIAGATEARADDIAPCSEPPGVTLQNFPGGLPNALANLLRERIGGLVAPGDDFDATDVQSTGRTRRAIFAWQRGQRWVVATEHGGIGYNNPLFAFDIMPDGTVANRIDITVANPDTVCSEATDLLEGNGASDTQEKFHCFLDSAIIEASRDGSQCQIELRP